MVWSRFSAWSKTMLAGDSKTSPVTSSPSGMGGVHHLGADAVLGSWNAGRQCMNLAGVAGAVHEVGVHLVGAEQVTARPRRPWLAHRHPDVGVDEVDAVHRRAGVVGDGDLRAGAPGDLVAVATTSSGGQLAGPTRRTSLPISRAPVTSSERPMLNRQSPTKA